MYVITHLRSLYHIALASCVIINMFPGRIIIHVCYNTPTRTISYSTSRCIIINMFPGPNIIHVCYNTPTNTIREYGSTVGMESYAFLMSTNNMYNASLCSLTFSMSCLATKIISIHPRPLRKPH